MIQSTFGVGVIPPIIPPVISSISGYQTIHRFASQGDLVNTVFWTPAGDAAYYKIYRDSGLTDLAETTGNSFFEDHQRRPNTFTTYYVVPVSALGVEGAAVSVTIP